MKKSFVAIAFGILAGCAPHMNRTSPEVPTLPSALLGVFTDDYGINYTISSSEWFQMPRARYHVVRIDTAAHFLIAQNDVNNPGDKGLYTRIDWVRLDNMAPFEWAFCLSAYKEASAEAAAAVTIAKPESPRTGCNKFPFSRMKRR